jgi:hypothetical protein
MWARLRRCGEGHPRTEHGAAFTGHGARVLRGMADGFESLSEAA